MAAVAVHREAPAFARSIRGGERRGPSVQEKVFNSQTNRLVRSGRATEDELRLLKEFLPEAGDFLVVPKRPDLIDLDRLMKLVVLNGMCGRSSFRFSYLTDEIIVPKGPYIIVGIENGRARLNIAPVESKRAIKEKKRSGFTVFEGVIYAAMFPVLVHHAIDCVGSRVNSASTPYISLEEYGPDLYFGGETVADPNSGAPSCSKRIGLEV
ncbi:MAG: DUF5701 family protein [Patescibacteria group bacterium]